MAVRKPERRLAAILAGDLVGYSRLMERDEAGTVARVRAFRAEILAPLLAEHGGRLVDVAGDGFLAEFASLVEAIGCGVDLQRGLTGRERDHRPQDERLRLRLGVSFGDVIVDGGNIFGEGVNVAARLQALADPDGICISRAVLNHVRGKVELDFASMGTRHLKNIEAPVEVWRVDLDRGAAAGGDAAKRRRPAWGRAAAGRRLLARRLAPRDGAVGLAFLAAVLAGAAGGLAGWRYLTAGPPVTSGRPSIAVMPFVRLGEGDGFLAPGLAEDIITELSRNRELRIIARDSAFALAGERPSPAEVSRRLGVRYILTGSVRRQGAELRINAELLDGEAGAGEAVWGERFRVDAAGIFAAQDEIVRQITGRLLSGVREEEKARAMRRPPGSLDVYALTTRGVALKHQLSKDALTAGRAALERAVELDPAYAPAQLYLGQLDLVDIAAGGLTGRYGLDDLDGVIARIRHAIDLDPALPAGYRVLSQALGRKGDAEGALHAATRSVELAPSNADNLNFLGVAEIRLGRYAEALASIGQALDLNPTGPAWYHLYRAQAHYALGDYAAAEAEAGDCALRAPGWPDCLVVLAASQGALAGPGETASRTVARLHALSPRYDLGTARRFTPYTQDPAVTERFVGHLRSAGLPPPSIAASAAAGAAAPR